MTAQVALPVSHSQRIRRGLLAGLVLVAIPPFLHAQETQEQRENRLKVATNSLTDQLPAVISDFSDERAAARRELARQVDAAAAAYLYGPMQRPDEWLPRLRRLVNIKAEIDRQLRALMDQRFTVGDEAASQQGRDRVRAFLRMTTDMIDLSGRLNFHLRDGVLFASISAANNADLRQRLVDQLDDDKSPIGAAMLAPLLLDPPRDLPNRPEPVPTELKQKILLMVGQRGGPETLGLMVRYLKSPNLPSDLAVLAADAAIRLGLPQNPVPAVEGEAAARPPLTTAEELRKQLAALDAARLNPALAKHRDSLTTWLERRGRIGVTSAGYWDGSCTIQPGDWILMRNSSPYNLFTDMSPGLFTHVGVATLSKESDGIQRMSIIDLNERQTVIRARNIEDALAGSLYYAVLRHEDPAVASKMSEVAVSLVGNPMKFDLTFETTRAAALKGKPLTGTKIETYCAGLLLICAQETPLPRSEFFPVPESVAPGKTAENMERIGLRVGQDFISPTGPLFAHRMKLVHFKDPMFDPAREIEQRIYDEFAERLATATIQPKGSLFQSLRQQLAEASKANPFLARAIADASGVDRETDLARAARAAAVVETLDEVAYGASGDFRDTLVAFRAGPLDDRAKPRFNDEQIARFKLLRERHAELYQKLERRQVSPRDVTEALIAHYIASGEEQIDRYFFATAAPAPNETK